jgi:timeless
MDVFSFNLVLNAKDRFQEHQKYGPLSHSVALLREMIQLLNMMMQNSSTDSHQNDDFIINATEQIMTMGLMDRLFYAIEPLGRLPMLLSRWTPGTSTREKLCDYVEITQVLLWRPTQSCVAQPLINPTTAMMMMRRNMTRLQR